eukprot:6180590-Alexandrium_andersonii.AAC.1
MCGSSPAGVIHAGCGDGLALTIRSWGLNMASCMRNAVGPSVALMSECPAAHGWGREGISSWHAVAHAASDR